MYQHIIIAGKIRFYSSLSRSRVRYQLLPIRQSVTFEWFSSKPHKFENLYSAKSEDFFLYFRKTLLTCQQNDPRLELWWSFTHNTVYRNIYCDAVHHRILPVYAKLHAKYLQSHNFSFVPNNTSMFQSKHFCYLFLQEHIYFSLQTLSFSSRNTLKIILSLGGTITATYCTFYNNKDQECRRNSVFLFFVTSL